MDYYLVVVKINGVKRERENNFTFLVRGCPNVTHRKVGLRRDARMCCLLQSAKQIKKEEEEAISEALPGLSYECWEKFDAMN